MREVKPLSYIIYSADEKAEQTGVSVDGSTF